MAHPRYRLPGRVSPLFRVLRLGKICFGRYFHHDRLSQMAVYSVAVFISKRVLMLINESKLALAAIAAAPAALAEMIGASIFGAIDADIARGLTAYRTCKSSYFHC